MTDLNSMKLRFCMNGARKFYQPDVMGPVLNVFERSPQFVPESYSVTDRQWQEYSREDVGLFVGGERSPFVLQLRRKKKCKYKAMVPLDDYSSMRLELTNTKLEKEWQSLLALSEELVAGYRPDIAWVNGLFFVEPPFAGRTEELLYMMNFSARTNGPGSLYYRYGPGGLSLRTYIGPDFIEKFSRELLLSTPAVVSELGWGGVVIDLVDNPWQCSPEELTMKWEKAMDHLSPAKVFAIHMPSNITNLTDDWWVMYGERVAYQGVKFWAHTRENRTEETPAQRKERGTKSLWQRAVASCEAGKWDEALTDLNTLIVGFEHPFYMAKCWCPTCDEFMIYEDHEDDYSRIDAGRASGYWPYNVRHRGYEYNPDEGDSQRGIPVGTAFEDLPDNWKCPICALAGKGEFRDQVVQKKEAVFQAEVYIARGKVYQKLGDIEKAGQDFQAAGTMDAIRREEIESFLSLQED